MAFIDFKKDMEKLNYFDELHISCDSEYGYYITYINKLRDISITRYFCEYEDILLILCDLITEIDLIKEGSK